MELRETILAKGHPNVTAKHRTTFEITKETHLTPRGDCIIAVCADRGLTDFTEEFRRALRDERTVLEIRMECGGIEEKALARGHPGLSLTNNEEMVVRKSIFTCGRTLAVGANKASCDLRRDFVKKLREGNELLVELTILPEKYNDCRRFDRGQKDSLHGAACMRSGSEHGEARQRYSDA